jgi:hypothetical protein
VVKGDWSSAGAFAAETENDKMVQSRRKSVIVAQGLFERGKVALVNRDHRVAVATEQVMVMRVLVDFVCHPPLTQISWIDEMELRQEIERAVDGGFVHVRIALANAPEDLVGGDVPAAVADDG